MYIIIEGEGGRFSEECSSSHNVDKIISLFDTGHVNYQKFQFKMKKYFMSLLSKNINKKEINIFVVVVYQVFCTAVANGPMAIGCILRTAGSFILIS